MKTKYYGWLIALILLPLAGGAQTVTNIVAGYTDSLFLESDGSLWAMGDNSNDELGGGTGIGPNQPEQILLSNVTAIAAGQYFSLFLKSDGSLWAVGDNGAGELGDGTYNNANQPEQIVPGNVTAISVGVSHSLFLKSDGSLWAMGDNTFGELGDGTFNDANQPEQIVPGNVTAISAGLYDSLFLKSDGSLWAMGDDENGQLGDGTTNNANQPELILPGNVTAIAAAFEFSLFLKSDGSLWAVGYNGQGELGDGTYYNANQPEEIVPGNVTAIAAGYESAHSLFLKSDGSLWGMGDNVFGELGDGTYNNVNQPEEIVPGNVTAIAAGGEHSLFLKNDGSLWAMGWNAYGQLGDGTTNNVNQPEQIEPSGVLKLNISLFGSNAQVSWSSTRAVLQTAKTLNGTWNDLPGAANPYLSPATNTAQFFRLRRATPVTTLPATYITTYAAYLNGVVTPIWGNTTYWFEYGSNTNYGATTAQASLPSSSYPVGVNIPISGLAAATVYHFQLVEMDVFGINYGGDQMFTTAPLPAPAVTTFAATSITATSAVLNGSINGYGQADAAYFQYGPTTSYGSSTYANQFFGDGYLQNYSNTASGLTPGVTYHFRAVGTTLGGLGYGQDFSFTTP